MSCSCRAFTSVHCCLVITWRETADLMALVCIVYCDFVTFPFGILGKVRYLIVSIPDPCCLCYFHYLIRIFPRWPPNLILEDLKVLRRSPDLFNNVKIGQGQLHLIIKHILFYHIWGLQPFWSSDLTQSNQILHQTAQWFLRNQCLYRYVAVQMSGIGKKVTGQLDIWYLYKAIES